MCVCVTEVGSSRSRTTAVTHDFNTYYTLYCMCVITSGRIRGATGEEDAVGEQQLIQKRTQLGCSLA